MRAANDVRSTAGTNNHGNYDSHSVITSASTRLTPIHPFEAMKLEQTDLRAEIKQSIDKQHQILIGGYALVGSLLGYIATKWPNIPPIIFFVIPFVFLAMVSLWAVETNRM